jgi:dienelactone hydrolase
VFPLPEQNIKAATQYLRGTANALGTRRDRVVVQGMSAGSRIAAVAYTHPDDDYFAGKELWPDISDEVNGFIGFYHTYDGSMQYSSQYYGGVDDSSDKAVRARWDKADSLASAANAVGPALFITGDKDWNLIIEHQNRFADTLEDNDIEATTVIIKGGSHGFDTGSTTRLSRLGEQAASAVLRWLNDEFPQDPRRPAESSTADLATAPNYTGSPPPSYETRRRSTPTVTSPSGTSPSSTTVSTVAPTTTTTEPPTTTSTTVEPSTTTVEPTTTTSEAPPDPP